MWAKLLFRLAYTPDGKYVYVSLRDENKVAIIDTATREVVDRVSVGRNPIQLFAASDAKMYVANGFPTLLPATIIASM